MRILTILCAAVCLCLAGCRNTTTPQNGKNEPVVSPTNISTQVQGEDKPMLPHLDPWYDECTNWVWDVIQ